MHSNIDDSCVTRPSGDLLRMLKQVDTIRFSAYIPKPYGVVCYKIHRSNPTSHVKLVFRLAADWEMLSRQLSYSTI